MPAHPKKPTSGRKRRKPEILLREFNTLRLRFDASHARKKLSLLRQLSESEYADARILKAYHDLLCFLFAYPDNAPIRKAAESELQSFAVRVDEYKKLARDRRGKKLVNSGIVDTTVEHLFSLEATRCLLNWHPGQLEIDWSQADDSTIESIDGILPLVSAWQETDIFDNDDYFDTNDWLAMARGNRTSSDLETLVKLFTSSGLTREVQQYLFENLNLTMSWDLTDSAASCTLKRLPRGRIYYQKGTRSRAKDLRREILKPPVPLRRLSVRDGKKYVQAINEVLAVRYRELFPITFANPAEVYVYEPGRGIQIAIFGTVPEIRLPLESNFGAMLIRNGLPIGYGISATLFDRVEIAINVFPAFRSGESSYIIEQFFKLFYHHFGSRVFLVRSRQMGDGDMEPIHAGSFWFYYKLGFRAIKPRIRKLAELEYATIKSKNGYRSPINMLKRLSKTDVFLHMDTGRMDDWSELSIVNLGYLITKYAAEKFNGNRALMTRKSVEHVTSVLKARDWKKWSPSEITALEKLAPLIANIPDLAKWSKTERAALIKVIRAKGAKQERRFALLSGRHKRFKKALEDLAG
ncbi:MAG: hypothetical protein DRP45_07985 [Candidatus Zixiibacteriota bacterium]|nr:MAG: hypothetical protein DRP45_07985 [candidate division Zixibacteria bacterium]